MEVTQRVFIRRCLGSLLFLPNRLIQEVTRIRGIVEVAGDSRKSRVDAISTHENERVSAVDELLGRRGLRSRRRQ